MSIRNSDSGRITGGLRTFQKPDADLSHLRHEPVRHFREAGKCRTDRYGAGLHRGNAFEPGILYAGQAESDE